MNRFFVLFFLLPFIFIGCGKEEQSAVTEVEVPDPADQSLLKVPYPTAEILTALGPENDLPVHRLLPNPVFVVVGKPKQFLGSPVGKENELLVSDTLVQFLQLYFNPAGIERFIQASGFPATASITVPNSQDNNAPPQQRLLQIARRSTILTLSEPVKKEVLLASVLGGEPDEATLNAIRRTEGTTEYFDVTPPNLAVPQKTAVGLIDEKTAVFVEGTEADIKAVFSDTPQKSAILDRLKHTPLGTSELILLTSLEGVNIKEDFLRQLLSQIGQYGIISQNLIPPIVQHFRALSFSLNVSAAEGQPVLSINTEARDEKGAEILGEAVQGLIIHAQTTLATMNDEAKKSLPMPADFATSLLNAMTVEVKGTRVNTSLNNFEKLIPMVAASIHARQIAQLRVNQMLGLYRFCSIYYEKNQKFPADILSADGKPLLSWRVALLPVMGLEELYNKFKLDEPWDSETNKELMNTMPMLFQPLGVSNTVPPKTVIRFFDSEGTPFANRELRGEDIKLPQSTLLYFSAAPEYALEWTKPESLEFNAEKIVEMAGNPLFGITFSGQICFVPLAPSTDPNYEKQKKNLESLIKGKPMQQTKE